MPGREAYKPIKPNVDKVKEYERQQKIAEIERENEVIMNKLVSINRRKPGNSQSSPNLALPPIKKSFSIPLYE